MAKNLKNKSLVVVIQLLLFMVIMVIRCNKGLIFVDDSTQKILIFQNPYYNYCFHKCTYKMYDIECWNLCLDRISDLVHDIVYLHILNSLCFVTTISGDVYARGIGFGYEFRYWTQIEFVEPVVKICAEFGDKNVIIGESGRVWIWNKISLYNGIFRFDDDYRVQSPNDNIFVVDVNHAIDKVLTIDGVVMSYHKKNTQYIFEKCQKYQNKLSTISNYGDDMYYQGLTPVIDIQGNLFIGEMRKIKNTSFVCTCQNLVFFVVDNTLYSTINSSRNTSSTKKYLLPDTIEIVLLVQYGFCTVAVAYRNGLVYLVDKNTDIPIKCLDTKYNFVADSKPVKSANKY